MNKKELWINQIKGLCICLVVIYHSVITFYPHLTTFQHPLSEVLSKCWIYLNLYLAPFRMPVFFFISGYLIRRYIDNVPWTTCVDKRIWSIAWVLVLWGVVQWLALVALNNWLAPQRDLTHAANAAYADSIADFTHGMLTASTSLWYLYALIVYFVLCKIFSRWAMPLLALFVALSVAINFFPTPWWGMNSVIRNLPWYSLGAWFGATLMAWIKEVPLRRHAVIVLGCTIVAVVAWLANVSLLLSLLSIVLIMKLFYQFELHFGMRASSPLSVIGANTIAIYTTHRILVELFSLTLIPKINHAAWPAYAELALLLVYPFACLLLCTLFGLLVRKISQKTVADLLFSPPSLSPASR
ncbi:acyltransferase family protein [Citrobacter freundii]|uniref:acyltransferase family protein n=1 Tax=Citrobacter TaxID=544 RepID=UPI0015EA474C|nr:MULTISPECIES: acyltransferase family protein [Citrobacter]MCW1433318.1 acyltransferase family protein [Citrobacter freundii]MBJ9029598.1 acyltransferase family protein [Citrobacter braakii]MCD9263465.1 acyltransferase family protein [Citrobacter braakii]MCW1444842.1 acyltransferase family protein [Citrobacter freundii]MDM3352259.1 acyltransferase family protein [Citrobacter sp. Cb007]